MYRVDIYLESESRYMGRRERRTGYFMSCILDNGQEYSDMKVIKSEGTWNHCMLEAMNEVNKRMKVAKAYIPRDDVWVAAEIMMDSTPELDDLVPRLLNILLGARKEFYDQIG